MMVISAPYMEACYDSVVDETPLTSSHLIGAAQFISHICYDKIT
jgi:hypothetical protein